MAACRMTYRRDKQGGINRRALQSSDTSACRNMVPRFSKTCTVILTQLALLPLRFSFRRP
jgi:hypothetical protein